jgi:hypothetical protein
MAGNEPVPASFPKNGFLAIAAVAAAIWWLTGLADVLTPDPNAWQREAILGVWADPAGEPGNSVRIELVESSSPPPNPLVRVLEGRVTFRRQFGLAAESHAVWNYENYHPLRLNIVFPGHSRILAVRFEDRDHAWMRLVTGIDAASSPAVMDHPAARRLSRLSPQAAR